MISRKKKWASPLFIVFLAFASVFGISSGLINKQVDEQPKIVEKANAAENETLPAAVVWVTDYVNSGFKYSIGSGDMHIRMSNVVFDSESAYTHVNQLSQADFPYVGNYVSGGNDGVLIAKMGYDSEHQIEGWKKWKLVIPWFVVECNVEFYAHNDNYLHYQGSDSVVDLKVWRGDDRWMNIERNGWSYQDNSDASGKKFYAKIDNGRTSTTYTYSQPKYDVAYNTNGGSSISSDVFKRGVKINQTTPTRSGYVFNGWYTESTFEHAFDINDPVKSDLNLYAKWEEQVIIIWYADNSNHSDWTWAYSWHKDTNTPKQAWPGVNMSSSVEKTVTNGKYYKWVISSWTSGRKPDWVIFNKGYSGDGNQTQDLALTYNTDYYGSGLWYYSLEDGSAGWRKYELSITYKDVGNVDFSGAHAASYPTTHYYGGTTALDTPTKNGYHFDGWYTDSSGNTKVTNNQLPDNSTADITLYAKWTSGKSAAQTFASGFNTTIGGICEDDGSTTFSTLKTAWNDPTGSTTASQEYKYNHLNDYVQYWLLHNPDGDITIGNYIAKYEYILKKYGYDSTSSKLHDFMETSPVKTAISTPSLYSLLGEEDNLTSIIIIVSSSIALVSITGLSILVLRKRKEKEEQ